jgi:AraC-like DNA-binding protein
LTVVFDAEIEPAKERDELWRHVLASATGPLEPRGTPDRCVAGEVGTVSVMEMFATGDGGARRTARHTSSSDPELCKIDVIAEGGGVVEQGGREAVLAPGEFSFVDLTRPATWAMSGRLRMVAIVFPRRLLPFTADEVASLTGQRLAHEGGAVALLSGLARQIPAQLGRHGPSEGARLGTAVVDLLVTALATRLGRDGVRVAGNRRRALLMEIHSFIEARLGDPALSPGGVAAAHFVSLRYLHKLFEGEQTTVADWIRRRRLERCRRDLLDPAFGGATVAAIGERWGLGDPAHFSRVFKRHFGAPPAEYRAAYARDMLAARYRD